MSILYSDPAYARRQILDHAAHQFAQGDVLHWWHESLHLGARTTFSDDYLWLPFVTYQYVTVTGDTSILTEQVPFCQADQLKPDEKERGVNYTTSAESATLYEHLRRSIDRSLSRIGSHGLPLMGCGDWNDGMSAVGAQGKGESVWVAFFLADLLPKMEQLTQMLPGADLSYCEQLAAARKELIAAIQTSAWDGAWFLRAYFDNGDPMGSRNNTECQIDLISQAWSILTDVATPEQKTSVFRETDRRLVNREHEIIQLLTPAFKDSQPSPGYIANYPVGVRENGGQYTHGAMWYIMAQLKEGRYDMAYYLYSIINPVHRTNSLADVLKYKVEPYCIAADIYSNPQHPGRGGWTWYTGSASWAYKTGIEDILGFHLHGDQLTLDPHVPTDWPYFTIRYRYANTTYIIHYQRSKAANTQTFTLVDDGQVHEINI
jgi:cellobiose phosphorylase